jgi:hypothetical protein
VFVNSSKFVYNSFVTFLIEKNQRALNLLNQEHIENLSTFFQFSECITSNIIQKRVFDFHTYQNSSIENFICCSCDIFIKSSDLIFLNLNDLTLFLLNNRINTCTFRNNKWNCYRSCYKFLQKNKIFLLSATNMINVIMCDEFFICLSNFIISKECFITRFYSLKIILRLRSNKEQNNFVKYFVIWEHFIILSQNSKSLSQILSNFSLKLNDKIKMIWIDKNAFTRDDIRFYVMIKKRKIWKILYWLSIHNSLYKNVHIDIKTMKKWKKEHIFYELKENVIHIFQFDYHEREDYVLNIEINNLKNELQALISDLKKSFNIDSVLFDINENKQNSTILILNDLNNLFTNKFNDVNIFDENITSKFRSTLINDKTKYVLFYSSFEKIIFKNNWNDSHYFIIAFSCLFSKNTEKYHDKRTMQISLQVYFKWALNHHNKVWI